MAMIASLAPWANKTELVAEEVRKHGQCIDELQRKTDKLTWSDVTERIGNLEDEIQSLRKMAQRTKVLFFV